MVQYSLPAEVPSTPPTPKIAAKSKSSVTIRWNVSRDHTCNYLLCYPFLQAPNDNGATIIEYCLEWNLVRYQLQDGPSFVEFSLQDCCSQCLLRSLCEKDFEGFAYYAK